MKQNNLLLATGIIAVMTLSVMFYVIYKQSQILEGLDKQTLTLSKQSVSNSEESIKEDLDQTELSDLDKELIDIDRELSSSD